nr:fumarylacetoacetate hydrolase family protein [Microcella alkalica]
MRCPLRSRGCGSRSSSRPRWAASCSRHSCWPSPRSWRSATSGSGELDDAVDDRNEVGDLRDGLRVRTIVNGETMQDGNTRDMIFEVGEVLALVSRTMTLNPGDVIVTGTPDGVGYVRTPPVLLGPGDTVTIDIERIGTVTTPVVAHPSAC